MCNPLYMWVYATAFALGGGGLIADRLCFVEAGPRTTRGPTLGGPVLQRPVRDFQAVFKNCSRHPRALHLPFQTPHPPLPPWVR